jgi:hypothetical protein
VPTTMQARALLAKWFVRVLNSDGPPWCVLARSLLSRHLATARRTLSDLLAGNVSRWRLKGVPTFWHSLLKTWDVLDGGARTNIVVLPNAYLATSALLVLVRTDDNRPVKTSNSYARFTNTSPVCPRCQQATESVEHALVECQEVYAFWSRLYQVLKFSQYSRSDTRSILSLYIARNRRGQLNVKACSLTLVCRLWVIHRARLCRHFSQTHSSSALMLLAEWRWLVRDILLAKRRTIMRRDVSMVQLNNA